METQYLDAALVAQLQSGQTAAFNPLMEKYYGSIQFFIFKMVKDTALAEDLMQDTFVKVYERLTNPDKPHDPDGNFKNWLYLVANSVCIDHIRKMRRQPPMTSILCPDHLDDQGMVEYQESPEEMRITLEWQLALQSCIHQLPDEQKETILLRFYGGVRFRDIAVITGVCLQTAAGRRRYALRNLAKLLETEQSPATLMLAS